MNLQRIINPFLTVFDEGINLFFVYEALQKRKKGFIIRCKFINLYFLQCTVSSGYLIDKAIDFPSTYLTLYK